MPHLHLTDEQQTMLARFIDQEPCGRDPMTNGLAELLEQVMSAVNVRRLESVDPERVRELLRSTFELMKVRHLHDNGLLSTTQLKVRLETARGRVAQPD
ncbi:MAG: hypothetical protein V7700_19110 [Halioglobus sp.]